MNKNKRIDFCLVNSSVCDLRRVLVFVLPLFLSILSGMAQARGNYYGYDGSSNKYGVQNAFRQKACDKAGDSAPYYQDKMKEACGANPNSVVCESYKDLYHSWAGVRKSYCHSRSSSGPLQ